MAKKKKVTKRKPTMRERLAQAETHVSQLNGAINRMNEAAMLAHVDRRIVAEIQHVFRDARVRALFEAFGVLGSAALVKS